MRKWKKLTVWIVLALLVIVGLLLLQRLTYRFEAEEIKIFVHSFGILGPLVLTVLITLTIVVSPLASLPFWLASIALYGNWPTCLFVVISNSVGSAVNFLIAQRWGRPVVSRLVGKKGIGQIDQVTEIIGLKMLFLARLIGGSSADYVSYAAGLTSMEFRPYFLISVFVSIPMICLHVFLLDKILTLEPLFIAFLIPLGYVLALVFPLVVYKWPKKK